MATLSNETEFEEDEEEEEDEVAIERQARFPSDSPFFHLQFLNFPNQCATCLAATSSIVQNV